MAKRKPADSPARTETHNREHAEMPAPPARPPKASSVDAPLPVTDAIPERPPKPAPPAPPATTEPTRTPPRPVNPEIMELQKRLHAKLSRSVAETQHALQQANEQLERLCDDLERGRPAMDDEMQRLRVVRDLCVVDAERLDTTVQKAQQQTADLQARPEPDVDHMLSATSLAENQCV